MQSKRKPGPAVEPIPADPLAAFAARPASQAWERLTFPDGSQNPVWAWFKPATAPNGVILRVPDEVYRDRPDLAAQWTVRKLLQVASLEPASVSAWVFNGVSFPAMNGASPYLDAPLPAPLAGANPGILVYVMAAADDPLNGGGPPAARNGSTRGQRQSPVRSRPDVRGRGPRRDAGRLPLIDRRQQAGPPQPLDAATADIFERIEADWNSSNEVEKDLSRVRKQLVDILGRLKALNRELTPPERVHSNNQDKKDWQDARRLLRDATNRAWKYLKAHDIGDTSNAGKRVWFEEIYRKFVAPRQQFDGLMAAARAFEMHRKTITQLHGDMSNAYSFASIDGERKAQQVIARIQTKVREASNRKNFLGVILDS